MSKKLIALVDMDDTLCNYSDTMFEELKKLSSDTEFPKYSWIHDDREHILLRRKMIQKIPGFWRNLKPIPVGIQLYHSLIDLEFETHILTKGPSTVPNAWTEKLNWCFEILTSEKNPSPLVTITMDKSLVYGKILVDDYPDYVEQWLKWRPRGYVFMPITRENNKFHNPRVFKFNQENINIAIEKINSIKEYILQQNESEKFGA